MIRHATLLLALAGTTAGAAERRFAITDFDRVIVEAPVRATLRTGAPSSAVASGDPRMIDRISIDVQDRTLRIRPNRSAWGGWPGERGDPVRIELATRSLQTVTVVGSAVLDVDRVKAMRFEAALSGTGSIRVGALEADSAMLGAVGAGTIQAAGTAKSLRVAVRGSASLDASGLRAGDAQVEADTSGSVTLTASRTAKVSASGVGEVTVAGSAACSVNASAAASVRCGR